MDVHHHQYISRDAYVMWPKMDYEVVIFITWTLHSAWSDHFTADIIGDKQYYMKETGINNKLSV